jgi:hypothetical protein
MGAMVCVPTISVDVTVEDTPLIEQPEIVSQKEAEETVFVVEAETVTKVVKLHKSAVSVSHSGSSSVVIRPSLPMVILGQSGKLPSISKPGGHSMRSIGGGPGP